LRNSDKEIIRLTLALDDLKKNSTKSNLLSQEVKLQHQKTVESLKKETLQKSTLLKTIEKRMQIIQNQLIKVEALSKK